MDQRLIKKLQSISEFPDLVAYLRDELDWPIETDDLDELTFEYSSDELGIDEANAAKIETIRRMRPLDTHQPWGIFFLELEPKRLPIVVLRKILSKLVLKNRASTDNVTWQADDILFVSNFHSVTGQRQIAFVHFESPETPQDLPVVKVLGWDGSDTALKVDWIVNKLKSNLRWPDDTSDHESWRRNWRKAFTLRHRQTITDSQTLALELAELASWVRTRIKDVLAVENDKGAMRRLMKAFRESLVSDLDEDGFADMYAQTIAYGLLSARIADPEKKTVDDLTAHIRTSPFLRELLGQFKNISGRKAKAGDSGIDFDELEVSEVKKLLDHTDMEAVLRDFGDRNRKEDPVMHFFEGFLDAYDKKIKKDRGVFYTPQPVVSYIVRSVHELLQSEFELEDGLADTTTWGEMIERNPEMKLPLLTDEPGETRTISPDESFVQILDPATGTATFLVEVIDIIHRTLTEKWIGEKLSESGQRKAWNEYVPKHLLPRLFAYELMMAPYAIAHMKLSLKLLETGYDFVSDERAQIYLTNALEPWQRQLKLPELEALAHEASAVNAIKRCQRFTVVIGNPPYSGHSSNTGEWITGLVKDYYFVDGAPLGERNPKWLQDDYVKFVRLAQNFLSQSNVGILGYITNHSYSDNPTFRGMRRSLMRMFCKLRFLDLHGNSKKKEKAPDGSKDENVFDIQQGVAILLATEKPVPINSEAVLHSHVWGERSSKYLSLGNSSVNSTNFENLSPTAPFYLFVPQDTNLRAEFEPFPSITEVFPINSMGVTTGDDNKYVAFRVSELHKTLKINSNIRDVAYRPFDERILYYDPDSLARARFKFMRHMLEYENLALVTIRRPRNDRVANFFVSNGLIDKCFISSLDNCQVLPLYTLPESDGLNFSEGISPNFSASFLNQLASTLAEKQTSEHLLPAPLTPEDIFHYAYAVFHSPGYRSRYAEFLKIDFPRLPLTSHLKLLCQLSRIGGELVALHLLESPALNSPITEHIGENRQVTNKIMWTDDGGGTVWSDGKGTMRAPQAGTSGFRPVPEEVWNFHIGGYQVCQKWLKDRGPKKGKPGRTLTDDDIAHYHKIIIALTETIRLMAEIDEVIEAHGGWPDAFATQADPDHKEYPHLMAAETEPSSDGAK